MEFSSSASAGPNAAPVVVTPAGSTNDRVDTSSEYFVAAPPPLHQRKTEYPVALPMRTDTTTNTTHTIPMPNNNSSSNSHNSAILLELSVQYDHPTIPRDSSATSAATTSNTHGGNAAKQHGLCTICRPVNTIPVSVSGENSGADTKLIFYRPQMALHKVLQQGTAAEAAAAAAIDPANTTQESNQQPSHKKDSATTAPAAAAAAALTSDNNINHSDHTTRVTVPSHFLPYVTLYGPQKQALWSLTSKDWHTMDFSSPQLDHVITLTTSTSLFTFMWLNRKTYQWRLLPATSQRKNQQQYHPYDLRCYHDDKLIAEFVDSRFVQWTQATDQQQQQQQQQQQFNPAHDIVFSSFLLLSGLLIHEHLSSILRSLGGGPEAVQLVTDPTFAATAMMDNNDHHDHYYYDDNDVNSVGEDSFYGEREYADQGLVDGQHAPATGSRWYTSRSGSLGSGGGGGGGGHGAGSVKSIELDPGFLRCFWGYGFWWTWCPCCMPGGWFDRMWINCRLRRKKMMANNTAPMSRSRQRRQRGWQQHHHPDQY